MKLTDIIARETHGISYKTLRYDFCDSNSCEDEFISVWRSSAESSQKSKYIDLESLSKNLAFSSEQKLTYFLDGSRKVFKVDEIAYKVSGGRRAEVYPVVAGQIVTGFCKRINRKIIPDKYKHEIVISLPDIADYDNNAKRGFWQALTKNSLQDS